MVVLASSSGPISGSAPRCPGSGSADTTTSHQVVAALAFGLAYASLPPERCLEELVETADLPLLLAARHRIRAERGSHHPSIAGRAEALIDAAVREADGTGRELRYPVVSTEHDVEAVV